MKPYINMIFRGDLIDEGESGLSQRDSRDFTYVGGLTEEIIEEENNEC